MTELSKKIIKEHLVRKTSSQKKAFRKELIGGLAASGISAHEEAYADLFRSVNVVAGDPDTAEIIFGAHYDTCPRMFFPNLITPCNRPVYYLYQLAVVAALLLAAAVPAAPAWLLISERAGFLIWYCLYIGLLLLMMKGPANPNTFNDNTSGITTLTELQLRLPADLRARCAFVYFDNEEMHMLGSSAFRKKHGKRLHSIPLVNIDCVGDGDYLLLAASRAFREDERLYSALRASFPDPESTLHVRLEAAVYPSDQSGFKKSLAVAALKKSRLVGCYIDKIHTPKDTVLREENIVRLTEGLSSAAQEYLA